MDHLMSTAYIYITAHSNKDYIHATHYITVTALMVVDL